jgi:hypothetical protein
MSFTVWLLETPWEFINGQAKPFHFSEINSEITIEVKVFLSYLIIPDRTTVTVDGCKINSENQSPIFYWQGKAYRRLILPMSSRRKTGEFQDQKIYFDLEGIRTALILSAMIQDQPIEQMSHAIKMQIERFQCLIDSHSFVNPIEAHFKLGVRRTWDHVSSTWLNDNLNSKEAPTNFITQRAQDKNLSHAIQLILKNPNRILQRQRDFVKIAAVSEMDSTCLQWYCKRPGLAPAEKAREDQTILAITRKETFQTLENRVMRWVIDELLIHCCQYLKDHAAYQHTDKYSAVKKFDAMIRNHFAKSPIKEVEPCDHHISVPNYVLMHHHAYKQIWEVYRQLQKENKLFEDCWKWQNVFWTETGGQIISSLLYHLSKLKIIKEIASSIPYYRKDFLCGHWADSPVTPGPFKKDKGIIYYIDSRDGQPSQLLCDWMGILGCQQMLHQVQSNGSEKMLALWYWPSQNTQEKFSLHFSLCLGALEESQSIIKKNSIKLGGLILAHTISDQITITQIGTTIPLWAICIPSGYQNSTDKLIRQFEKILKFFD